MPALAPPQPAPTATPDGTAATPTLDLKLTGGAALTARVRSVREQVAEVEIAEDGGPVLPVGLIAEASVAVAGLGRPLPAHVRVLWRRTGDDGLRHYGISLPALGQRGGAMTAALCAAFNRRACQRVRPEPLAHPLVKLESVDGKTARGPMNDISLGGLSLQVAAEVENDFAAVDALEVTVHLTAAQAPVRLAARIRSRQLCGTRVRYGLEFEAAGGNRSAVLDYVLARRDECLRRARRTTRPEQL
jgi:hypothetical protein